MDQFNSNSPQPLLKGAPALVYPANYQAPFTGNQFPTAILTGAGNAWKSGILPIFGLMPTLAIATPQNNPRAACWWDNVTATCTSTQNVTITINWYLDAAGLTPVGTAASSTAGTTPSVGGNPAMPFLYFQVTISNTSGTTAIITNTAIAVGAT